MQREKRSGKEAGKGRSGEQRERRSGKEEERGE